MEELKRYHPLIMVIDLIGFIRGLLFPVIFLFLLNRDTESRLIIYGRYAFYLFVVISILYIFLKWLTYKYRVDERTFHLSKGVFVKSNQTIPFTKVQNINKKTSIAHRILGMTSVRFETGISGEDSTVEFKAITKEEVKRLEELVESYRVPDHVADPSPEENVDSRRNDDAVLKKEKERTIHFTPSKKDTLKAAFTSFNFLIIIPILVTIYSNASDVFQLEERARGLLSSLGNSIFSSVIIFVFLLLLSIGIGILFTFYKYGKYEISSDDERIYITKGVLSETSFTITKERVQAIEIKQTLLKRILGLAEVKLTSAGKISLEEKDAEVSSLYPFLPVKKAYSMVSELLPEYKVTETMAKLPQASLLVRLCKPYWLWSIATGALFFFKPSIFGMEVAWWKLSIILFVFFVLLRILDFFHTRYVLVNNFVQFKSGSLTTSLFVSKREKIVEISVSRSPLQKKLGLASVGTINRASPVQVNNLQDVPVELAQEFSQWYFNRRKE